MQKFIFGLGGMVVGAGLMFILMKGEVKAEVKPKPFVCSEVVESIFQGEAENRQRAHLCIRSRFLGQSFSAIRDGTGGMRVCKVH